MNYADGKEAGEHILDLIAKSGEQASDDAELVYLGSQAVWREPDGTVVVVTLETECSGF